MKINLIIFQLLTLMSFGLLAQSDFYNYKIAKSIVVPGDEKWDYSIVDKDDRKLYISHGSKVQVIDLKKDTLVGEISNLSGVHGIALATNAKKGYISNGKSSTVTVFDLGSLKIIKTIEMKGKDPDAIIYDSFSNCIYAFCGSSNNVNVINVKNDSVIKTIPLEDNPEFAVSDNKGKIYVNIEGKSEIAVIKTDSFKVSSYWPLGTCKEPTGIAIDAYNERLYVTSHNEGILAVVNYTNGKVVSTLPIGKKTDAVILDETSPQHLILCSNGDGTLSIIKQIDADDSDHFKVIQTLTTQPGSKTMAFDPNSKRIFLCAAEFNGKKVIPGTFKILVAQRGGTQPGGKIKK